MDGRCIYNAWYVYVYCMNTIPAWALKYKTRGVYIRDVGNNYYAYRTRSKWVKEEKRTKTPPPEYLDVVTRNGIVRKDQVMGIRCVQLLRTYIKQKNIPGNVRNKGVGDRP